MEIRKLGDANLLALIQHIQQTMQTIYVLFVALLALLDITTLQFAKILAKLVMAIIQQEYA
jgi:hypothetical protein